ncbi:penicillin-binding protein 1B [Pseudohaliea sp.]|uniref:penicillin-binding protein 1B n=1 Tax=Pseudohaliea sp. TaxID=2740289 RepID=UPI0032EDAF52
MTKTRRPLLKLAIVLLVLAGVGVVMLDARITATFSDRMWALPAKVYARPLELFVGAPLSAEDLAWELELLGYRPVNSARAPGQYSRNGSVFDIYTRGFAFPSEREPARGVRLVLSGGRVSALVSGSEDVPLMRLDPLQIGGIYPSHGEDRILVRLNDVPETLVAGLLTVEDRRFYEHWGFSITGIARAAFSNLRSGRVVAGGSTITQQLVKNYYLTPERTIVRKLTEIAMAVLLELHYSKDAILESYLNEVYLGQEGPRAIHGFALAARHYFQAPLPQLGLHQQALLVGMIKGPSLYNPLRNPARATERRNLVLDEMAEAGIINDGQAAVAKAMPLGVNRAPRVRDAFPAYLDLVRRQLREEYREEDLATLGLSIFTPFDPILQRQLERSTDAVLGGLDGDLETASIVTRVDTGEVAALVGGRQVRYAGFNRALDARRPAGSLLKPAVYLAALEQPERYTLATRIDDSPLRHEAKGGQVWEPENFEETFHGEVPLYAALAKSYNVASARLGLELGVDRVHDMLERLGLPEAPAVPAVALGAGEYSPLMIARLYQAIAAGGFRMPLRSIRDIVDAHGEPLKRYPLAYDRRVDQRAVHLLHYALRAVVREGTGRTVYRRLPQAFAVAGKTGTTDGFRDSWFAGFSGDLLAVSWIGHDDNRATGLTGATGAGRIWSDFMAAAARRPLAYRMPGGVSLHWVDEATGLKSREGCEGARLLPFIDGSEPEGRSPCARRGNPVRDWFQRLFGDES